MAEQMMDACTFLLVDANLAYRAILRAIVQSEPRWSILAETGDGLSATQLATQYRPDVILMNIDMPVMSGLEATRHIKRATESAHIILFSSYRDEEFHYASLAAGGDYYLSQEHIDNQTLTSLISRLSFFVKGHANA
jgi:two-component system response regulator DegU